MSVLGRLLVLVLLATQINAGDLHLHPPAQHPVVISDLKLDDTGAIHALARAPETKHVHVIGSNLINDGAAKGHLDDFMNRMGHGGKYSYYGGQRPVIPHDVTSTHEQNFVGTSSQATKTVDDLDRYIPRGASVDIYHIAPAHPQMVDKLVKNKNYDVKTFHHVQGYNSIVSATDNNREDGEATYAFLSSIGKKTKEAHPNSDIIFSNSASSFTDRIGGSTQPLRVLRDTFPANHLKAATMDPFHARQLRTIEDHVVAGKRAEGHKLPPLPDVSPDKIHSAIYGDNHVLRQQLSHYVKEAMPHIEKHGNKKLEMRAKKGLANAFDKDRDPAVEMCDAVHVEACLTARRNKNHGAFQPVRFEQTYNRNSDTSFTSHAKARHGQEHGHMLVNQSGSAFADSLRSSS
jgi:hypothetical protein